MPNDASGVLWRRLKYFLSPQLEIYKAIAPHAVDKDVLEIGFGTGFGTVQYSPYAKSVVATEIDPHAVEFAESHLGAGNVDWVLGEVRGKYDLIVSLEVLEHVPDPEAFLAGIAKQLHMDGSAIISTPNANGTFRKNDIHERELTADQLTKLLHQYFRSVKLYDYTIQNRQTSSTKQTPLVAVCRLPML